MPIFVVSITRQNGTSVLHNTAISFAGGTFIQLFRQAIENKNNIHVNFTHDNISEIRLREKSQSPYIAANSSEMDVVELTTSLGCKFVDFIINWIWFPYSNIWFLVLFIFNSFEFWPSNVLIRMLLMRNIDIQHNQIKHFILVLVFVSNMCFS